ncbi:unnamed protein product [Cylicostephanus goldi]|uniref:Tyrosine-protein phosphatase domain-containing protein n=1 Tax=Cylicostephanus goldi TaxID=71465 RepID=A0A3P6SHE2_CYLGO|nr:unnamed protein product [Cylicostephanus goldi]
MSKESSVGAERTLLRPSAYHAIPVDDLPSEYLMRHRDSDFLFAQEYENFQVVPLEFLDEEVSRYNDIRAFDATRVKLRIINEDENSDYINANFVKGWDDRKTFIAAQAPLDTTISDFWRMIWEQDARLIVMVANLFEKNRQQCTKYWPDDQPTRFGLNSVLLRFLNHVIFRSFQARWSHICSCFRYGDLLMFRYRDYQ